MSVLFLETARLVIRPFVMDDLQDIHGILDGELAGADYGYDAVKSLEERKQWLRWTAMNYEQLDRLHQPPYGDRAIVLKATNQLIGAIGFVPCLAPFEQLPSLGVSAEGLSFYTTECGLYYALSPSFQRQGYATEAAHAMIDYAFSALKLKRIVAMTTFDNAASTGVMRKLGMRIEKNPRSEPAWLQVVGILENVRQDRTP